MTPKESDILFATLNESIVSLRKEMIRLQALNNDYRRAILEYTHCNVFNKRSSEVCGSCSLGFLCHILPDDELLRGREDD
jgi:hypothetical protein